MNFQTLIKRASSLINSQISWCVFDEIQNKIIKFVNYNSNYIVICVRQNFSSHVFLILLTSNAMYIYDNVKLQSYDFTKLLYPDKQIIIQNDSLQKYKEYEFDCGTICLKNLNNLLTSNGK